MQYSDSGIKLVLSKKSVKWGEGCTFVVYYYTINPKRYVCYCRGVGPGGLGALNQRIFDFLGRKLCILVPFLVV